MQAGYGLPALARAAATCRFGNSVLETTESTESPDCQEM